MIGVTVLSLGGVVGTSAAAAAPTTRIPEARYRTGTPAVALDGTGRLTLFGTDGDDNIWHRQQNIPGQDTWTGWSPIEGKLRSIAAETNVDGRMENFGVNSDGRVYQRWQQADRTWSPWSPINDRLMASLTMARDGADRLMVFATDAQDNVWHRWQLQPGGPTGWSGWVQLDGQLRSVTAEANVNGLIELFGVNADGRVWHRWQEAGGGWSPWSPNLEGQKSALAVVRNDQANGRLELFALDSSDQIQHRWQERPGTNDWTPWTTIDGLLRSIAADTNQDGRPELFGVNAAGRVYHRWATPRPGVWSSWSEYPAYLKPMYGIAGAGIAYGNDVQRFVQGVTTPHTTVRIAPYVDLDLSGRQEIQIATGVRIQGFRSAESPRGPRLFTTTNPYSLFLIGNDYDESKYPDGNWVAVADNVKISGIRLDGGLQNPDDAVGIEHSAHGIIIGSSLGVEISDSELYRWSGAAISVNDAKGRIEQDYPQGVWIHDNFIYLNQHPSDGKGGAGYGVVVGAGAYTLIEQNVFDRNTHSITASGDAGGYYAHKNLVFAPGFSRPNGSAYGHFFDVHGDLACNYACGHAGEYFEVRFNTFVDDREVGVKLRGIPGGEGVANPGMHVSYNAFSQQRDRAFTQTQTGLQNWSNLFGVHYFGEAGHFRCDFDRDGIADQWTASGQTMWYLSSARSQGDHVHWVFVMQTDKRAGAITSTDLATYIADGRCS